MENKNRLELKTLHECPWCNKDFVEIETIDTNNVATARVETLDGKQPKEWIINSAMNKRVKQ